MLATIRNHSRALAVLALIGALWMSEGVRCGDRHMGASAYATSNPTTGPSVTVKASPKPVPVRRPTYTGPSAQIAPYVNKCINYYKPNSTHVDSNVIARVCTNMTRNSSGEPFFLGLGLETTWAPPGGNFTGNVSTLVDVPNDSGAFSCYATIGDGDTYDDCGGITWTTNQTLQITVDTASYGPACVYATYSAISITQNTGCPGNG